MTDQRCVLDRLVIAGQADGIEARKRYYSINERIPMNITITKSAQEKLLAIMAEAEYKKPALRILFSGMG